MKVLLLLGILMLIALAVIIYGCLIIAAQADRAMERIMEEEREKDALG